MSRRIALLFLSLFLVYANGFSMGKKPAEDHVKGTIAYYGNEPFVTMAIKANDGKVYRIKSDERTLKSLRAEFGKKIEFYGALTVTEKKPNELHEYDGVMEVEYFEVLD